MIKHYRLGLSGSQNLIAAALRGSFPSLFLIVIAGFFLPALGRLNQRGDPKAGAGPLQRRRL